MHKDHQPFGLGRPQQLGGQQHAATCQLELLGAGMVRQRHGSNPADNADLGSIGIAGGNGGQPAAISSIPTAALLLTGTRSAELTTALNIHAADRSMLSINAADAAQH
jgi:hypothetical protein